MASGITHMILSKLATEELTEDQIDLQELLQEHQKYFRLGAVAPDLPYSQEIEWIFSKETEIADLFHYTQTNQVPLRALKEVKKIEDTAQKETAFAFFLGYISHVVADGVIHPFVRDKVGDYHVGDNAKEHRILEMNLDVLLLNHLSGLELNYTNLHDGMLAPLNSDFDHITSIFSSIINEVYGKKVEKDDVIEWAKGLHFLFSVAENEHNWFYSKLPMFKDFAFAPSENIVGKKDKYLTLKKDQHEGATVNFMDREVHFINDCVEQFKKKMIPLMIKAYGYVFNDLDEVSEIDLPAINLDTGRELKVSSADETVRKGENLDQEVVFWKS